MTTAVDRNAGFNAERANQIAAAGAARDAQIAANSARVADFDDRVAQGKLISLGDGRFRVNDPNSWDNGETLRLTQTAVGALILPEHNLDESTGKAALYSRTPAWHQLGTVVPEGLRDVGEILRAGGIDFEVVTRPVLYQPTMGAEPLPLADRYVTVRTDLGTGLGVVGKVYRVIQNRQAYDFMAALLGLEDGDEAAMACETVGALYGGHKVFMTLRLPESIVIDPDGIADEIVPYVSAINSHDGRSQFEVVASPWRIACSNTERFAVRDAVTRWSTSHTSGAMSRISEARRTLKLSNAYYESFVAEETALAQAELTMAEFRKLVDVVWADGVPQPGDGKRKQTNYDRRHQELGALFAGYREELGGTAYAAERAVTEFSDWRRDIVAADGRESYRRAAAALVGLDDTRKSMAHRHLMTLVRGRR